MAQTTSADDKLKGALGKLASLATPALQNPAEQAPLKIENEPTPPKRNPSEALQKAPKKSIVVLEEKKMPKKVGRPTSKLGDLETDYVKISPKIPRNLKDAMDDAIPSLRRRGYDGITSMEDFVKRAIEMYLKRLKD